MTTLFEPNMQNEKIAAIVLVVVIVGALSTYIAIEYGDEILNNIFPGDQSIELGDCVDVNYIGRYAKDNTIFDSSYEDIDNKTGGNPLNVFVSLDTTDYPPEGYEAYSSAFIEGFMEGLIGLKEGETATIGPIPPEKAYGDNKLKVGDTFNSALLALGTNISVEVTELTEESISLKWINIDEMGNFTTPQAAIIDFDKLELGDQEGALTIFPPGYIWENASTIVEYTDDLVTVKINPTSSENILDVITPIYVQGNIVTPSFYLCPDATTATWDNDTITLTCSPTLGATYNLTQNYYGMEYTTIFTVENISDDKLNFSIMLASEEVNESDKTYMEVNKTLSFDRSFTMPRNYNNISMTMISYYYLMDIQQAGYSLNELAGEELLFEVTIVKVYKFD